MGRRILDLYCGAGGAARGYYRDGDEIIGVDHLPQPRYPFTFIQADAVGFPLDGYDIIHASPPCQDHSSLRFNWINARGDGWLLEDTLRRLANSDAKAWVVENVESVTFPPAQFMLCGTSFNLITRDGSRQYLRRHRKFWSSHALVAPRCQCRWRKDAGWRCAGVHGGGASINPRRGNQTTMARAQALMDIDWMKRDELAQAIPPAYTRWIRHRLEDAFATGMGMA